MVFVRTSLTFSKSWSWQNNHRWHSHRPDHGTMVEENSHEGLDTEAILRFQPKNTPSFTKKGHPGKKLHTTIFHVHPKASVYATS